MVSRALQVARAEPCGPVYMSFPREIILLPMTEAKFPTADQLGIPRPAAIDQDSAKEIAQKLVKAQNPHRRRLGLGQESRDRAGAGARCASCWACRWSMPRRGIYQSLPDEPSALPGHDQPQGRRRGAGARGERAVDARPQRARPRRLDRGDRPRSDQGCAIPTYEFTADMRLVARPAAGDPRDHRGGREAALGASDRSARRRPGAALGASLARHAAEARGRGAVQGQEHAGRSGLAQPPARAGARRQLHRARRHAADAALQRIPVASSKPGSYFHNPGSSGGWGPGAALGAKIAAPDRDVVLATGDGFWHVRRANAALVVGDASPRAVPADHLSEPQLHHRHARREATRSAPTATRRSAIIAGGYFDPPIDFAKEAEARGAYGENVRDPAEVGPAIKRGLAQIRRGTPAVIAVWLPRLLQKD